MKKRIEAIMHGEAQSRLFSFASLLQIFSLLYGGSLKVREFCYQQKILKSKRLPCKVFSVGNLTVGGTGKTPMTIYLADLIRRLGYRVTVISRGYRGSAEKAGGIVSDGRKLLLGAKHAGDEPYLIAARLPTIPVIVGRNRFAAGMLAVRDFQPDVIVLDDAFQHLKLKRDVDLVLLDYTHPFGNTHLLPRGILRETISALYRGDALILTRCRADIKEKMVCVPAQFNGLIANIPIFAAAHTPYFYRIASGAGADIHTISEFLSIEDLEFLESRKAFAFSGIARNDEFQRTVESLECEVKAFRAFPDHYHYSADDISTLIRTARDVGADMMITSEKDHARIAARKSWPLELLVIGVKISFGDREKDFKLFIKERLSGSEE